MPTTAAQQAIEKIEADIEFARSLYLAAETAAVVAALARFATTTAAYKARATAKAYRGNTANVNAYAAANIAAKESSVAYNKAYDEAEIASTRLQTLCDKLANLQAR